MKKYTIWSFICLLSFVTLFSLLATGYLPRLLGQISLFLLVALPVLGFIFSLKTHKGFQKWALILLHIINFSSIIYILLLGFGMGEA